jgi:2-polyprenyl-6-methoxyphenol hydroxylase-like FAD-dependent oxidoreductase
MGIEHDILAANTGEQGLQFIGLHGEVTASFPKDEALSGTRELEILRGDLVKILYDLTRESVEYRFDDSITKLDQHADGVTVTFRSGIVETFHLVVAADGIGSRTRGLMFGNEARFKFLGLYMAYLTIPKVADDTAWWRWYTAPNSRVVILRPDNHGTTRAAVAFLEATEAYDNRSPDEQKAIVKDKLKNAGWQADRISRAIDTANDLYLEKVGQIKAPRWSDGRIAMVGDAAYCASPLSGKGTTLALVGAYILAGELATHARHEDAFVAYEKRLRPYVEEIQKLPPGVPRMAYPSSKLGVKVINFFAGLASSRLVQRVVGLFSKKGVEAEEKDITLPDFLRDFAHKRT